MKKNITTPEKASIEGLEAKWSKTWEEESVYRFDSSVPTEKVYSIDTPPPTVSGSLHIGHVFSYTHTDIIARFKRMSGYEVFYPMGFDDNGVPTERRVQNYFRVRCEVDIPYDPSFEPPLSPGKEQLPISRRNFIELCNKLTQEDESAFEDLWRKLGLSVDWAQTYTTVGELAQRVSQKAFLSLLRKGEAYSANAPTLWDIDFRTAVSQAELEDRSIGGSYHKIAFHDGTGGQVAIETSRPELLPAVVALVAHPDDERYLSMEGKIVYSPLFSAPVPIRLHPLADPAKGTGIAMICTFGDVTDVTWWKDLELPLRLIIQRDGTLASKIPWGSDHFPSAYPALAETNYEVLALKPVPAARKEIVALLRESGDLISDTLNVSHSVKFYEKGERPLEIVASRQWFIKTMEHKERLLELGDKLQWIPPYMKVRYENWVKGLASDWNISRQRFFGIPIPIWYPLDDQGAPQYDRSILPSADSLPVDPQSDTPPGFVETQRNQPGGFVGDPDIMDTWATSSLTPQISAAWGDDSSLWTKLFPMDLRPQGHDIIRTWLFYTVLRSKLEYDKLPWRTAAISGFVLDPDRKKMSKSKGNVITPMPLLVLHGADSLRYWAAGGRSGVDTAADESQMKMGRRLAIKVLNATKFALSIASRPPEDLVGAVGTLDPLDLSMLVGLDKVVEMATRSLESFDYTTALEVTERFFWRFCDDYLELVKIRAYGEEGSNADERFSPAATASARATLLGGISVLLRLLAPYLPFASEEGWSWFEEGSIHRASWPIIGEGLSIASTQFVAVTTTEPAHSDNTKLASLFDEASWVLTSIRKAKSEAKVSMKTPVSRVLISGDADLLDTISLCRNDLIRAGGIEQFEIGEGERAVLVTLD